ncbi:MAG: phosphate ABC transporter substrate-binding protein [Verrucomicrobia bacterium]|nr:phosphate ABC transporter substrate-binding protein [Verrucomicrobiota bacterium]
MKAFALCISVLALLAGLGLAAGAAGSDTSIVVDGSTTVGPIAKAFAEYYMERNPGVNITVSESGSGNGAKSLVNGTCDVADMSRFMKDEEVKAAIEKGITPVAHVVALDGIAVIVHPSNPVNGLTVEQVRGIYTGTITNWKELGGPDKAIVVCSRDTNSGTYETFESLVMNKGKMASATEYYGSNGAVHKKVSTTATAIGYVGLGFLDRKVKGLTINGIAPSPETVKSGIYPIARPLFMFTNGYPSMGTHLHAFVTLYLSRHGQEIVETLGFVPVTDYTTGPTKE